MSFQAYLDKPRTGNRLASGEEAGSIVAARQDEFGRQ